jgi:hypothetical protein
MFSLNGAAEVAATLELLMTNRVSYADNLAAVDYERMFFNNFGSRFESGVNKPPCALLRFSFRA